MRVIEYAYGYPRFGVLQGDKHRRKPKEIEIIVVRICGRHVLNLADIAKGGPKLQRDLKSCNAKLLYFFIFQVVLANQIAELFRN